MSAKVEFSTLRYEQVHGRKPRGYTLWYFTLPCGITLSHTGSYWDASRAIAKEVRRLRPSEHLRLQVCA